MLDRSSIAAAALALLMAPSAAPAADDSKYPDLNGRRVRAGGPRGAGRIGLVPQYRCSTPVRPPTLAGDR